MVGEGIKTSETKSDKFEVEIKSNLEKFLSQQEPPLSELQVSRYDGTDTKFYSDVKISNPSNGNSIWMEVKLNKYANLGGPSMDYSDGTWSCKTTDEEDPLSQFYVDAITKGSEKFISFCREYLGKDDIRLPKDLSPELIDAWKASGSVDDTDNDVQFITNKIPIEGFGEKIAEYYKTAKYEPVYYMQVGDELYIVDPEYNPLGLRTRDGHDLKTLADAYRIGRIQFRAKGIEKKLKDEVKYYYSIVCDVKILADDEKDDGEYNCSFSSEDKFPIVGGEASSVNESITIPENPSDRLETELRKLLKGKTDFKGHEDRVIRWYRNDRKAGKDEDDLETVYIKNISNIGDLLKTYSKYVSALKSHGGSKKVEIERTDGKKVKLDAVREFDKIGKLDVARKFISIIGDQLFGGVAVGEKSKYSINQSDLENIELIGSTENVMCWSTRTYESTNKFVYQLWQNAKTLGRGDVYGDPSEQTPYCTHSRQHWDDYAAQFGEENYRQYWFLEKLDDGFDYSDGNLSKKNVSQLFNEMKGLGPKILLAMNDSNGDMLDRDDQSIDDEEIEKLDHGGEILKLNQTVVEQSIDRSVEECVKKLDDFMAKGLKNGQKPTTLLAAARSNFPNEFAMMRTFTVPEGTRFIGARLFEDCEELRSIVIPSSVKSIGDMAFDSCKKLKNVAISDGVERIGWRSFRNCVSLEKIVIPNTVKEIGNDAFKESGLAEVVIPDSVTGTLGQQSFERCNSLKSVVVGSGVKIIGDSAFSECQRLEHVKIEGQNLMEISHRAFCGCHVLKDIELPDSVDGIASYAFSNCRMLSVKRLPRNLEIIGDRAFYNCHNIYADIPPKVRKIGEKAFYQCESMARVTLPDSLFNENPFEQPIQSGAFYGCIDLKMITISRSSYDKLALKHDMPKWFLEYVGCPDAKLDVIENMEKRDMNEAKKFFKRGVEVILEEWRPELDDAPYNQWGEKWLKLDSGHYVPSILREILDNVAIDPTEEHRPDKINLGPVHRTENGVFIATLFGGCNGGGDKKNLIFYLSAVKKVVQKVVEHFGRTWLVDWDNDCADDVWTLRIAFRDEEGEEKDQAMVEIYNQLMKIYADEQNMNQEEQKSSQEDEYLKPQVSVAGQAVDILAELVGGKPLHEKVKGFDVHSIERGGDKYRFVIVRRPWDNLVVYKNDEPGEFFAFDSDLSSEKFQQQKAEFIRKFSGEVSEAEQDIGGEKSDAVPRDGVKIWIDDIREAPAGFLWLKSVNDFIDYCHENGIDDVTLIDTDHDAGDYQKDGGDYIRCFDYLDFCGCEGITVHIHSANPVGANNIRRIVTKNKDKGWREIRNS